MEQNRKMTKKEKMILWIAILIGLGIGGLLGIIAYYEQWLG